MKTGKLLEWAEVFGHRYGTPRRPVEKALRAGRDVLFDIDWQGTQQLAREGARRSRQRLYLAAHRSRSWSEGSSAARRTAAPSSRARMAKAAGEMSHWPEYDYVIVNRDKTRAFADVRAILAAERLKRERQIGLSAFVRDLQAKL